MATRKSEAARQGRKPYVGPRLTVYGTVEKITGGDSGSPTDTPANGSKPNATV